MSITLTTGKLIQINGATVENNNTGANMDINVDFFGNTATFQFKTGSMQNNALNAGAYGDTVNLTINLLTGDWRTDSGLSGTVPLSSVKAFVNQMIGIRNLAESFAAAGTGIMPGVQVPWPTVA